MGLPNRVRIFVRVTCSDVRILVPKHRVVDDGAVGETVVLRDGAVIGDLRQRWIKTLYKCGGAGSRVGVGGGVNEELRVVEGLRTDTHDADIWIGPG